MRLFIVFLLFISTLTLNAQNQNIQEWIILKNNTTAYQDKELSIKTELPIFNYKEKVYGVLLKDSLKTIREWVVEIKEGNQTLYIPFPEIIQNRINTGNGNLEIGSENVDIHHPLPMNYKPNDLELLDQKWNYHRKDYPKYIRSEVLKALLEMLEAAQADQMHLCVVSAFRDFDKQRSLYLRAIAKKGIHQIGTAKPAHSEHQLGTTVDLSSNNRKDVLSVSFDLTPEGKWLKENAHKYGFVQSYTKENAAVEGYMSEPWHFRYVGPKQ